MKSQKSVKVIFDTNIWISFLIGKRLSTLKEKITLQHLVIIFSDQLLAEFNLVSLRPPFQKYFPRDKVDELFSFMLIIGKIYKCKTKHVFIKDPKDSHLLNLIAASKADYLVTGDKDLIELGTFLTAKIIGPSDFEKEILF